MWLFFFHWFVCTMSLIAGSLEGRYVEFHCKTDGLEILFTVKNMAVSEGVRTCLHDMWALTYGRRSPQWPGGR